MLAAIVISPGCNVRQTFFPQQFFHLRFGLWCQVLFRYQRS